MSFVVSARKYRPQTFDDVLGQHHITDTLKSAILADKLAHAFLFTGPRGVGKTTCARILAKVINAEDPKKAIQEQSYGDSDIDVAMNIFELDAASNNSVEHIRSLIEQVRFQPQQGKFKVFIIDEVHMLSQAAFNAFLKTLEEPPSYAIFILATTEKHKILPTILSRCQIFDFKRIQVSEMIQQLNLIAEKEEIKIDENSKYAISELADGAMRDALSIFDRIASSSGSAIIYDDLVEKLNLLDHDYYFNMTEALIGQNNVAVLQLLSEVLMKGFEGDHFINGLASHFRNLLLCQDPQSIQLLETSDSLKDRYLQQSQLISSAYVITGLSLLNECDINYPKAKNKNLHIEITLLKLCYVNSLIKHTGSNRSNAQLGEKKTEVISSAPLQKKLVNADSTPAIKAKKFEVVEMVVESDKSIAKTPNQAGQEQSNLENQILPENAEEMTIGEAGTDSELMNTPSISSLDSLLDEIKGEEITENESSSSMSIERVQAIWDKYKAEVTIPSTKTVLTKTILEVKDNSLVINVASVIAKEILQQEIKLMQEIRSSLRNNDLDIVINIDKSMFPETEVELPKMYMSFKEKYELMAEKNPNLKELVKLLDLKKDNNLY